MEKSINITINNTMFSIDEDAYERLDKYLKSIKRHYGGDKEGNEILIDIEAGICEKFSAKKKKVINKKDVSEIIKTMGSVEEIDGENTDAKKASIKEESKKSSTFDTQNKNTKYKRLYRNPDDVIIAGVCSGIAAYFNIDPVFIRLAFVLSIFMGGFGIVAYIVMWAIMPKATSSTQKLEMQGKSINIEHIQEVVKEKSKMIGEESKEIFNKIRENKTWYKILNFPIMILKNIFSFIAKVLQALGPIILIFFGIIFITSMMLSILGLSIFFGMITFNINSEYIVSDFPIQELIGSIYYYIGAISVYLVALIPLIFILLLGITMMRRKNYFKAGLNGILVAIWMVAIVGIFVAGGDIAPRINAHIQEMNEKEKVIKSYEESDFTKLYIGGYVHAEIKKGDEFKIELSGRQDDLDRIEFNTEEGQLQITQKKRKIKGKICLLCFDKPVKADIVIPYLDSFVGISNSEVEIGDFESDLYVSLGESARAKIEISNDSTECNLSGVGSRLEFTGKTKNLKCALDGYSRLYTEEFTADNIDINQDISSRVYLEGKAKNFTVDLANWSKLKAFGLITESIKIKASDYTEAEIYANKSLEAIASGYADIEYQGDPEELKKETYGQGEIEISDGYESEMTIKNNGNFEISVNPKKYAPWMSSVRGLTLQAIDDYDEDIELIWTAEEGGLLTSWEGENILKNEIRINAKDEVYWTYFPETLKRSEGEIFFIDVEARRDDKKIDIQKIELKVKENGIVEFVDER